MAEIVGLTVNSKTKQLQLIGALGVGKLQEKTVEANEKEQVISPDYGYYGLKSVTVVAVEVLPNAKYYEFGGDESGGKYVIEDETITPLFKQVQRITETEDAMTFDGAEEALLNVVPGGGLPSAEESAFGVAADTEIGIKSYGTVSTSTRAYYGTTGWKFTAAEAFSIIGFRQMQNVAGTKRIVLWDSSGNVVANINAEENTTEWINYYLDNPINVAIGETYTISSCASYISFTPKSGTTFNSKLSNIQPLFAPGNAFPTQTENNVALVDIIIAPVQAELPDSYEIQRTTMDDIAEEIQRISGATSKMNTAEMLTALKAITTE